MTYKVSLHKRVEKFLDKHEDAFVLRFKEKVKIMQKNPFDEPLA